jgi:NAD(P)-dependent dehydrogenase (short-subunit alcohol dehydrogenase family)
VTAHYNSNSQTLTDYAESLADQSLLSHLKLMQCNLTSEEEVSSFFERSSQEKYGPFQIAVINHAVYPAKDVPLKDMSLDQWNHTINTNLTSTFLVAREYMRHLSQCTEDQKKSASILMIGSTAGSFGEAYHADYAATKSGLGSRTSLSCCNYANTS